MAVRTITGQELVTYALLGLGAIDPGESLTDEEVQNGLDSLMLMVAEMAGPPDFIDPGLKMWIRESATLTLVADQESYSIKASGGDLDIEPPEGLISVMLRDTDNNDTVLTEMDIHEYNAIGNKVEDGTITKYYYERQNDEGSLVFNYQPADATDTVIIKYRRRIETPTASANIDLPDYAFRAIKWSLAVELYPEYRTGDLKVVTGLAVDARRKLSTRFPHDATKEWYFQPDLEY